MLSDALLLLTAHSPDYNDLATREGISMDGHSDVERWKAPTWQRGDVRFMPRHEYERNALELDRN